MKKKIWIPIAVFALVLILFVPLPKGICEDGGTRVYEALTYKIIKWNRATGESVYRKTRIYFFSEKNQSVDELWEKESNQIDRSFIGTVLEMHGSYVIVQPMNDCVERLSGDQIAFSTKGFADIHAKVGSVVKVTYRGAIRETSPGQIHAVAWDLSE